jgi:branched-subunit amino acid aminotransferase/4-amino-4-deoxychorismate lyase
MSSSKDFASVLMLDGVPLDAGAANICASWPALMRGEGIFEAFLVNAAKMPIMIADHSARLCFSASLTGFDVGADDLQFRLKQFLQLIPEGPWRVRCTVLRGESSQQHWLFSAGPEQPAPESVVLSISDFRLDPLDPMAGAKTISRIMHQRARSIAVEQGAYEALFLTIDGDIAEGTSTNIFVFAEGKLLTPPLNRGILGGVTRQNVLRACAESGIDYAEKRIEIHDLATADEVYVSNAVIGLIPVTKILKIREDLPGSEGSKLMKIQDAYRRFIESQTI